MAFGFSQRTSGLIVDPVSASPAVRRYLRDFATAYADEVAIVSDDHASTERVPATMHPDLLFTTRTGDRALAAAIGAQFVPCFPDSSLQSAHEPMRSSPLLKVCLFGPESTGKTTLARDLARHYATPHVTEYVRSYLDAIGSACTADDMHWIARGQRAAEIATALQAGRLLICDTNLATIVLWNDVLFAATPQWMRDGAAAQHYDLWLLTDIDVPFEPDPQRCFPSAEDREAFMRRCRGVIDEHNARHVLVNGDPRARLLIATTAIDRLLGAR